MQLVTSGGSMSFESEASPVTINMPPKEIALLLKNLWNKFNEKPIPDFDREEFSPNKTMLKYKDELNELQPDVERWYRERGKSIPEWPKIYFAPVEGWAIYYHSRKEAKAIKDEIERDNWVAEQILLYSAICPWRYTQGIYRFAPSFGKALCESSLKGEIPCEVLLRLPQWSIYVEMPSIRFRDTTIIGFWAHLQNADKTLEKAELALLLNTVNDEMSQALVPVVFPLEPVTLEELMRKRLENWLTNPLSQEDSEALGIRKDVFAACFSHEEVRKAFYQYYAQAFQPIFAMLLYLCTTEPDIVSKRQPGLKPTNNYGRHLNKGFRLFPAEGPHIWLVGQSMENDMAQHYRVVNTSIITPQAGKKREVRSHVRSAHWHGYWKGHRPKLNEKDMREFIFHWIPPLLVRGSRDINPFVD